MITYTEGNLLTAEVDALVNTVNTVGVMGKGIALQFKRAFPENFAAYVRACRDGDVRIGSMYVHDCGTLVKPRYVINFPTKRHWRSSSRLEDVEQGLIDLRRVIQDLGIESIAVPPLGCGNGGLAWVDVEPLIVDQLGRLSDVEVRVYPPRGAPLADEMPNNQPPPEMNRERAAFVVLLDRYVKRALASGFSVEPRATLLEVHKLVYLFQRAGDDISLSFEKGIYGPYSPGLDRAIARLEGSFIQGFGDGTGGSLVLLSPDVAAVSLAADRMERDTVFWAAVERLESLIEGYEHPYGMELLGTLTYAADALAANGEVTYEAAASYVKAWTPRKQRMFTDGHLGAAWERVTSWSLVGS